MPVSLQEFVRDALAQVVRGIEDAKRTVGPDLADQICPQMVSVARGSPITETTVRARYRNGTCDADVLRFDVAVYAGDTIEVVAPVQPTMWSALKARLRGKPSGEDRPVTRIQFEIPVILAKPGFVAPWRPTPEMIPTEKEKIAERR